jgi:hypothetical protein
MEMVSLDNQYRCPVVRRSDMDAGRQSRPRQQVLGMYNVGGRGKESRGRLLEIFVTIEQSGTSINYSKKLY